MATLGLSTACGQQNFENKDANGFLEVTETPGVIILDVRTAAEYADGHLPGAINIDQANSDFIDKVKASLPADKTIALYCRSGRRSANVAGILANEGYKCVNLKGGIIAWKDAGLPVTTDTYEVDVFKTKSGKTVKFHALVHASIRIEYDNMEIQIDPVTKLGQRIIDCTAMPKADCIFVTHEHGDHFDKEAIRQLSGDKTHLITNKRCADMLGYGEVMTNGHDNGYILTIDGLRIYIAGDTEDIPEMADIKDIDIAFLPCNQPYTMTPEQLVKAAKTFKPKVLFPYHYGNTDLSGLSEQLKDDNIEVRIRHYE